MLGFPTFWEDSICGFARLARVIPAAITTFFTVWSPLTSTIDRRDGSSFLISWEWETQISRLRRTPPRRAIPRSVHQLDAALGEFVEAVCRVTPLFYPRTTTTTWDPDE